MAANTDIEWADHTFNPWRGCTKVSPGCKNCYAAKFATGRLRMPVWGQDAERKIASESLWRKPLLWNKRAADNGVRERVFCASMADVFEDYQGPDAARVMEARERLWSLIEATTSLDWLLLTKRPQNVMNMVPVRWYERVVPSATPGDHGSPYLGVWAPDRWPANVWIGCTVENQDQARERLPHLLKVPSKVRFVSYEPALEAVDFAKWLWPVRFIDWLIVGGESGSNARPFDVSWARKTVFQCNAAGVPVFVKQLGANPWLDGVPYHIASNKGGLMSELPPDLALREVPQ